MWVTAKPEIPYEHYPRFPSNRVRPRPPGQQPFPNPSRQAAGARPPHRPRRVAGRQPLPPQRRRARNTATPAGVRQHVVVIFRSRTRALARALSLQRSHFMPTDQLVDAKSILEALAELKRSGITPLMEHLEATEPD